MTSREEEIAGKLRTYLDQAAADLRPGVAYRLQQARAEAMRRLTENPQEAGSGHLVGAHGLVGAGASGGSFRTSEERPRLTPGRLWIGIALVAAAMLGWQQWTAWQELYELEDLDAQILSSDLPVDALVDRGFHLFLQIAPTLAPEEGPPAEAAGATTAEDAPAAEGSTPPASAPAAAKPAE